MLFLLHILTLHPPLYSVSGREMNIFSMFLYDSSFAFFKMSPIFATYFHR